MAFCTDSAINFSVLAGPLRLRLDIIDTPSGCTLPGAPAFNGFRFDISLSAFTVTTASGSTHYNPADGSHGGPPLANWFSNTRVELPGADLTLTSLAAHLINQFTGLEEDITFSLPIANDQTVTMCELDLTAAITLTGTAGLASPGPLTFVLDVGPLHGTLGPLVGAAVTYTPTVGYHGTDSFTFHVTDGANSSAVGTISLVIQEGLWWILTTGTKVQACAQPDCSQIPYDVVDDGVTYPAGICMDWIETTSPDASYCEAPDGSWLHGKCPVIPGQWRLQRFTVKPREESSS